MTSRLETKCMWALGLIVGIPRKHKYAHVWRLLEYGIDTVTFMIGAGTFRIVRLVPCMMQHFTVHRVMWALTPFYRDLCFRIFRNKKNLCERICLLVFRSKPTRPTSFRREYQGISLASSPTNHIPTPLLYELSHYLVYEADDWRGAGQTTRQRQRWV